MIKTLSNLDKTHIVRKVWVSRFRIDIWTEMN